MIIRISHIEAKNLVGAALGLSGAPFDLVISTAEPALLTAFRTALREFPRHASDQKILAIKRFRDLAPRDRDGFYSCVGLADAKWAVEHADLAIANLLTFGRLLP